MSLEQFEAQASQIGLLGILVTKDGEQVYRKTWDDECRRNVYSASKSFTSTAVGIAIREGLLSLDEKLVDVFPDELPEVVSENLAKATVRDCLTMCLGQGKPFLMGTMRPFYEEDNWVKLCLAQEFTDAPGEKFLYNNVGPYLAGILVQRRAGCDLVSYLMPRLFKPLGIKHPTWECDPLGNTFGAGGLFLTMRELHKLGLLYLNEGKWEGKQLVPKEWVKECAKAQDVPHYSYLFWRGEQGTYRADGKYCQLSIIAPEKNAVITTVAECRDSKTLNRLIFDHVYPML